MTIQDLYEWAKTNDCLNLEVKARDFYGDYHRVNSDALNIIKNTICINAKEKQFDSL